MPYLGDPTTALVLEMLSSPSPGLGSELVAFTQAGTGAVTRDSQGKMREVEFSNTDFPSIQAAIDALAALGGGRLSIPVIRSGGVEIPHEITSALVGASNVDIVGPGWIKQTTGSEDLLTLTSVSNVTIQGLKLEHVSSTGRAIAATSCTDLTIDGNEVLNVGAAPGSAVGISVSLGVRTRITNNKVSGGLGVSAADIACTQSQYSIIQGNWCLSDNSDGIIIGGYGDGPDDCIIANNVIVGHSRHGIIAAYAATPYVVRATVAGNIVVGAPRVGIYINGGSNAVSHIAVTGNVVHACGGEDASIEGGIMLGAPKNVVVANNVITDTGFDTAGAARANLSNGIRVNAVWDSTVIANNVVNNSSGNGINATCSVSSKGLLIQGNTITDSGTNLILVQPSGAGVLCSVDILNNIVRHVTTNPNGHGIFLNASSSGAYNICNVVGNTVVRTVAVANFYGIFSNVLFDSGRWDENIVDTWAIGIYKSSSASGHFYVGKKLSIDHNKILNCTIGVGVDTVSGVWAAVGSKNMFVNCGSTGINAVNGRLLTAVQYSPTLVAYRNSVTAPADGAWNAGDTLWSTTPAAGGTPGLVCTTAGTPGTWKAMAVVAA